MIYKNVIHKIEFRAMGSRVMAALEASREDADILRKVPAWFEEWEQSLSRFRPDSELNRLNLADGKPFYASRTLWDVLCLSIDNARQTDGLVTPEVLVELEAAGYRQSFAQHATAGFSPRFDPSLQGSRLDEIYMEPQKRMVILPPGLRLDLGGCGKGWAAHQAMRRLKRFGAALVDAGGDISISGARQDGSPWPVGVQVPLNSERAPLLLALRHNSVATSGRDYRQWVASGMLMHHIIDPRIGRPAETDVLTATILAPDVMEAEMAAKAALILGSRMATAWIEARPHLAAFLLLENGETVEAGNFSSYLWSSL
jgi:FAD:protein FMN transferase